MARMHILQQTAPNTYSVVVHAPTPAGNNLAGVPWATAIQNAGLAVSSLPVGSGPGQITNAENVQVSSGSVIEAQFVWGDNPAWTNVERIDDLNLRAQQAVDAVVSEYQQRLKQFGRTVT